MQRQGHRLTIVGVEGEVVATCECGKWRRALPAPDGADLADLVATLNGKHERHLDRLGRPAMGESGDGPLVPPAGS